MTDVFKELVAHFQAAHTAAHCYSWRRLQQRGFQAARAAAHIRAAAARLREALPNCSNGSTRDVCEVATHVALPSCPDGSTCALRSASCSLKLPSCPLGSTQRTVQLDENTPHVFQAARTAAHQLEGSGGASVYFQTAHTAAHPLGFQTEKNSIFQATHSAAHTLNSRKLAKQFFQATRSAAHDESAPHLVVYVFQATHSAAHSTENRIALADHFQPAHTAAPIKYWSKIAASASKLPTGSTHDSGSFPRLPGLSTHDRCLQRTGGALPSCPHGSTPRFPACPADPRLPTCQRQHTTACK